MTRTWYRTFTTLLWLAPPVMGARYWLLWDRLPVRMATRFDFSGRVNGWMPRDMSLYFTLGFLVIVLAIFSFVLYLIQRRYSLTTLSWALLAFFHAEIWTTVYMLNSTLNYNIDGAPIVVAPLLIVSSLGALAIVGLAYADKRGAALHRSDLVAEEVHSGRLWSMLFLLPLVAMVATSLAVPNPVARLGVVLLAIVIVAMFALAWDGFHYSFTRHGIEIRALGLRLKSIPLMQIKNYEIQSWSPVRGYGIRGIGNCKAYVWAKSGVRVEMYDGEVFLGHSDPQRIVHDLNAIKRYQNS